MSPLNYKISLLAIALTLTGCGAQQIANTKHMDAAAIKQAASSTQTPQQICETASMAVARGNKQELHFYAPLHLEQASDALEDGQENIKSKETLAEGVQQCIKVNKLVDNGIAMKAKVITSLSDSLAELKMLKKVDAAKNFSDDIQDFSDDIVDLVKEIEGGQMNDAMQGQAELMKDMLELEIEIVTDKNLAPVEAMIEKAEDVDADDLAEKTFEKAENELDSAKKFIRAHYRDDAQVEKTAALAMRSAKHAYHVAKEVETLIGLKAEAAEEKVLYIESLFERINKKFNQQVVIGNSLYEQSTIVGQRVDSLVDNKGTRHPIPPFNAQPQQQAVATKLPVEQKIEAVALKAEPLAEEPTVIEPLATEPETSTEVLTVSPEESVEPSVMEPSAVEPETSTEILAVKAEESLEPSEAPMDEVKVDEEVNIEDSLEEDMPVSENSDVTNEPVEEPTAENIETITAPEAVTNIQTAQSELLDVDAKAVEIVE